MLVYDLDALRKSGAEFSFLVNKLNKGLCALRRHYTASGEAITEEDFIAADLPDSEPSVSEIMEELSFLGTVYPRVLRIYEDGQEDIEALAKSYGIRTEIFGRMGERPSEAVKLKDEQDEIAKGFRESGGELSVNGSNPGIGAIIDAIEKDLTLAGQIVNAQSEFWQGEAADIFKRQWKEQEAALNHIIRDVKDRFGMADGIRDCAIDSEALDGGFLY